MTLFHVHLLEDKGKRGLSVTLLYALTLNVFAETNQNQNHIAIGFKLFIFEFSLHFSLWNGWSPNDIKTSDSDKQQTSGKAI